MYEQNEHKQKAVVLAAVRVPAELNFELSLRELRGLAEACALQVVGECVQSLEHPDPASCMGSGKIQELKALCTLHEATCVVFNNTLSPGQLSRLVKELDMEVLDKTGLILQIFHERARSAEASVQVEYARLQYMLPRLVGLRAGLSRQGGTGGSMSNRGAGETQLELDRRHIEKRMTELRRELKSLAKNRSTQRRSRVNAGLPLVALVGYTNAGKSTLLNQLLKRYGAPEEKQVFAKNMLFATLDTSIRKLVPERRRPFLLSDTVGFINELPHHLVEAFHSTLEEAAMADLILELVDCSDSHHQTHMEVTARTLAELGAAHIPVLHVMNKADLSEFSYPRLQGERLYISASEGEGLELLVDEIDKRLHSLDINCSFLIPYSEPGVENRLRSLAQITACEYREDGVFLHASLPPERLGQFQAYLCLT